MYRYLGMIWNRQAPFRERVATQLSLRLRERCTEYGVALDRPGLRVFTTYRQGALDAHLLESNRGVVIGSIFERREDLFDESPTPIAAFDAHRTNRIVESQGRALVSGYWGNYVAFLIGGPTSAIRILKDPTGPLPCHIASFCGISIIFSCLQDCLDIGIRPFSVNWDYVAAKVASNGVDASQNPLNNVSSLCPGQCIEFDAENVAIHSRRLYWKPVSFSEPSSALDDTDLAAKALRATVRSVTHTLIRGHGSILLRLSGGLDSSIIAGCLRGLGSEAKIRAYVAFAPGGKSDERRWARLSAGHSGLELIEWPIDPHRVSLEPAVRMQASVNPPHVLVRMIRGEMEKELAMRQPYSATISGHGGDSVFGAEAVRHVLDDFLRLRGPRLGALNIASDVALRTDGLAWVVLAGAVRRWLRGSRMQDFRNRLMNRQSLAASHLQSTALRMDRFPHPWFREHADVPWHVIRRVGALILPTEFYDPTQPPSAEAPLELAPLYSQPVTELSLRIPLHVHFGLGIERGLARKAFAEDVPPAILSRLWKDRAPGHAEAVALHNRALFRDIVLGGALAQARLIDCATIEGMLEGAFSKGAYFVGELFALLDLELWMRRVSDCALPT